VREEVPVLVDRATLDRHAVSIDRIHGAYVFPDTSVYSLGDKPQYVYSVRFSARELWGDDAVPQDGVYIDMWDDYLEPA